MRGGIATQGRPSVRDVAGRAAPRLAAGDLGLLPVIVGLGVIAVAFQLLNSNFLTPRNLSYLSLQIGSLAVLTIGVSLVLLVGEIDLSVGSVSGLCGAIMAVLISSHGWPGWAAMLACLAAGAVVGLVQGCWVVVIGVPSFIVTLTGLLVWQGLQLIVLGNQGETAVNDRFIDDISAAYLPSGVGIGIAIGVCLAAGGYLVISRRLIARSGYENAPLVSDWTRWALIAIVTLGSTLVLNQFLGVPYLLLGVVLITTFFGVVTSQTPLGWHIYAVGGNSEAARRAGVRVPQLKLMLFMTVAVLAAVAGIIDASRGLVVTVNSGGGNITLEAIAAAVIGGTSLFGGRGRIPGALLGALLIGAVANGLDLLGQSAAAQTIATGLILLAAVSVDVLSRRRRTRRSLASFAS